MQATISAVWLAENMSVNPISVNSTISPVQKSKIECKTMRLNAKQWNWVQNGEIKNDQDSSDKIELGQEKLAEKTETKIEILYLSFITKTS